MVAPPALLFGFSSRVWDALAFYLIVLPLALAWMAVMIDVVRRTDLSISNKALWFGAIIPFPLIGTAFYLFRRPNLRTNVRAVRKSTARAGEARRLASDSLDNASTTVYLAQASLTQSAAILRQLLAVLSETSSAFSFRVPFTDIRPLGPMEDRVARLTFQARSLTFTLERLAEALGTNAKDLQTLARNLETLSMMADENDEPPLLATLPERSSEQRIPAAQSDAQDVASKSVDQG